MNPRLIIIALACWPAASASGASPSSQPNILLILADDLGYSDLGCYGGEMHTPNIDALAARGVRFTQLYNSARCCPSRASLMTGLYPSQAGIGDFTTSDPSPNRGPGYLGRLNDQCVTLAEVLKPAGYHCYYVGKWHLHPQTGPVRRGFNEFYGFTRGHSHDQYDADYYLRLPEGRRKDLARRMAVFAAMVETVDRGVGKIVDHLKVTGDFDNTLILFLSDNGACYEWGPFGFDGVSRQGTTTVHRGADLRKIGGPGTHQSYGSAWANLGNTPLRLYKHFTHEGGISTPFIMHWPQGIGRLERWVREPAHVMDILPTLMAAAGAAYPTDFQGHSILPPEGISLLPAARGGQLPARSLGFDHESAHALRKGDWKLVWSKRMPHQIQWELYNLAQDRCETTDLAQTYPDRVKQMAAEWEAWARRVQVIYEPADAGDYPPPNPLRGKVSDLKVP